MKTKRQAARLISMISVFIMLISGCASSSGTPGPSNAGTTNAGTTNAGTTIAGVTDTDKTAAETTVSPAKADLYTLSLKVSNEENLFLATYGLKLFIDGKKIATISHGGSYSDSIKLAAGDHVLRIEDADNDRYFKTIGFRLESDISAECKVKNHTDFIEVTSKGFETQRTDVSPAEASLDGIRKAIFGEIADLYEKTEGIIAADGSVNVVGLYLDDALRVLKAYDLPESSIKYTADSGKMIVVKNNWQVISQSADDDNVYLECTKVRSGGIIDAAHEVISENYAVFETIGSRVRSIYDAYQTVKLARELVHDVKDAFS